MDAGTKVARQRLSVLELAKTPGNVREARRQRGMARTETGAPVGTAGLAAALPSPRRGTSRRPQSPPAGDFNPRISSPPADHAGHADRVGAAG